jgi:hypothetical protein
VAMLSKDCKTASVFDAARLWAHQLEQPVADVQTLLLRAIWSGDLRLQNPAGPLPIRQLLLLLQKTQPHPGISIVSDLSEIPPAQEPTEDGGMIVRLDHFVVLPGGSESWSGAVINAASTALVEAEVAEFSESFLAAIMPLSLDQDEFADWCTAESHPWPKFWLGGKEDEQVSFRGRPSIMAKIRLELRRRAEAGIMNSVLREESEDLAAWARHRFQSEVPQAKSIENGIRHLYRELAGKPRKKA